MSSHSINPALKQLIDQSPISYERFLIHGLITSIKTFRKLRNKICPFDPATRQFRHDFSTQKYNILFELIFQYWSAFDLMTIPERDFGIPKDHLQGILIDRGNSYPDNSPPRAAVVELLQDLEEDIKPENPPDALTIQTLTEAPFAYWLDTRLAKQVSRSIQAAASERPVTLQDINQQVAQALNMASTAANDRLFSGAAIMTGASKRIDKTPLPLFPKLNAALGGGLAKGEATLIGGVAGGGKTVLSAQLVFAFARQQRKVVLVTTEQKPKEYLHRMLSNDLSVSINEFRENENTGESTPNIPSWIINDPNYSSKLNEFYHEVSRNFMIVDWSRGDRFSIVGNLDSELLALKAQGFDPEVLVFDWVGGGLERLKHRDQLRHAYQDAADHIVNICKAWNIIGICFAQIDKVKAAKSKVITQDMLSECKTMTNNMTNFIGISSLRLINRLDAGEEANATLQRKQYFNVEKSRHGPGGVIVMDQVFQFQRWVQPDNRVPPSN